MARKVIVICDVCGKDNVTCSDDSFLHTNIGTVGGSIKKYDDICFSCIRTLEKKFYIMMDDLRTRG